MAEDQEHDPGSPVLPPSDSDILSDEGPPPTLSSCSDRNDEGTGSEPDKCCQAGCLEAVRESVFLSKQLEEIRAGLEEATNAERAQLQFALLRQWGAGNKFGSWRKYVWKLPLCVKAVC